MICHNLIEIVAIHCPDGTQTLYQRSFLVGEVDSWLWLDCIRYANVALPFEILPYNQICLKMEDVCSLTLTKCSD
jgi:hypothetical protein